ncbi:alkane 1-monooxygenase [Wenzhouxiangella marina]|uniref:Alkane 1-monooxygenase n=1 Tax=Wenzhouxiangella marina TaxID=1579979 RepID=A0A0K0XY64_9GAMM|nr:alkane 1-monooxygenase [Wenzhouxiangella marina]AKS42610.1 alkane 1-monooxygenase [Wenzhouxiangella marina]MBB6085608.1 alkane 1-monooxygenase [Wenzhouxiangella marina]
MNSIPAQMSAPAAYRDRKRYAWLLSVLYPPLPLYAVGLHHLTGQEAWFLLPLLLTYGLIPLLDYLLGEDAGNPPEAAVPELQADRYYRWLTWLTVPLHLITLVVACAYAVTAGLGLSAFLLLALVTGLASGMAVNTAHEMGHHRHPVDQALSRIALAVPFYGHFTVEHNYGHHKQVATPEDSASARLGETIYGFALREIPGGLKRAWRIERARLARRGRSIFSLHNTILQSNLIALLLQGALIWLLGWPALVFLLVHNLVAWFQLTSANYVEHYGLLRRRLADGRYERCQPHHSWNSNHVMSNLLLFHLERHSDHHAHPGRRYQCLRDFDDVPRLPSGYFGMFLLAYLPPLWFRVMNPRLMELPHVDGELARVNRGN